MDGTRVRATPSCLQNKNGLIECRWQYLTKMAQCFLTEAKLPKRFWFWAIREANLCLDIFPITQQKDGSNDRVFMTTPHFEFSSTKPDYRIVYPFGSIGKFCHTRDSNHTHNNFESQCMLRIVLGKSDYINGMVFYNTIMDSFYTLANNLIEKNCHIGEGSPSLRHKGLAMSVLSGKDDTRTKFNIGDCVFVQDNKIYDILEGRVTMPSTIMNKYYIVTLGNDSLVHNIDPSDLYGANDVPSTRKPSASLGFL